MGYQNSQIYGVRSIMVSTTVCGTVSEGSIPSVPTNYLGVVQFGRTLALGARGRRFKSCHLGHNMQYWCSMAASQSSKLVVRVRIPCTAPICPVSSVE